MANILVCDDERSICEMLDISLRREGHRVETVQAGQTAKNKIDGALYDVIITDIKMPNIDGIEVLRHAHRVSPDSAVILMTAVDDYEAAVEAVKAGGASDYIRKSPGLGRRDQAGHQSRARKIGSQQAEFCVTPRRRHSQFTRQHHRFESRDGKAEADGANRSLPPRAPF